MHIVEKKNLIDEKDKYLFAVEHNKKIIMLKIINK